jgi:hypothetical protein
LPSSENLLEGSSFTFASRGPVCRPNSFAHREKDGCTRPLRCSPLARPRKHDLALCRQGPLFARYLQRTPAVTSVHSAPSSSLRIAYPRGNSHPWSEATATLVYHNSPPIPTHHSNNNHVAHGFLRPGRFLFVLQLYPTTAELSELRAHPTLLYLDLNPPLQHCKNRYSF